MDITLELDVLGPELGDIFTLGGQVTVTSKDEVTTEDAVYTCHVSGSPWAVLAWLMANYTNMDSDPQDAALDLMRPAGTQGEWYQGAQVAGY